MLIQSKKPKSPYPKIPITASTLPRPQTPLDHILLPPPPAGAAAPLAVGRLRPPARLHPPPPSCSPPPVVASPRLSPPSPSRTPSVASALLLASARRRLPPPSRSPPSTAVHSPPPASLRPRPPSCTPPSARSPPSVATRSIVSIRCLSFLQILVLQVETFAQFGVVFLLFALGLEFTLAKLKVVGPVAILGGLLQVVLFMFLCGLTAVMCGAKSSEGVFVGAFLSMSSTAVELGFQSTLWTTSKGTWEPH